MLIEFTVGNFLSFKGKKSINLNVAKAISAPDHIDLITHGSNKLLPSAVIYGPNASGKTNLVVAMHFMKNFVLDSSADSNAEVDIATTPFKLCTSNLEQPSLFEIIFVKNSIKYRYGFTADNKRIQSEWLYRTKQREILLFSRNLSKITIRSSFKEGRRLESKTRENALFLSVVTQFNGKISREVYTWFKLDFDVVSAIIPRHLRGKTAAFISEGQKNKSIVESLINKFDVGISKITVQEEIMSDEEYPDYLAPLMKEVRDNLGSLKIINILTTHEVYDDHMQVVDNVIFDINGEESDGTERLFTLIGPIIEALFTGSTLVIDEFDNRLHPLILNSLIMLFQSQEVNRRGAQLIIATHNVKLLEFDLFRRDQIWFCEKLKDSSTDLYSLADYKFPDGRHVRTERNYGEDYIKGRYGAIPFIGDIERIFKEFNASE